MAPTIRETVQTLIKTKQYAAARAVLETMGDDEWAAKGLAWLDKNAPVEEPELSQNRNLSPLIILLGAVTLVVLVAAGVLVGRELNKREIANTFGGLGGGPIEADVSAAFVTPTNVSAVVAVIEKPTATLTPLSTETIAPTNTTTFTSTPHPTPVITTDTGKWKSDTTRSELDNTTTTILRLDAENQVSGSTISSKPTLILRCKNRQTEVYVAAGMQLKEDYDTHTTPIRMKLDDLDVIAINGDVASSGDAVFLPTGGTAQTVTTFALAKRLVFEITPFEALPDEAVFDLKGLRSTIMTVKQSCGW